jgi:molecular chaperone GrpE
MSRAFEESSPPEPEDDTEPRAAADPEKEATPADPEPEGPPDPTSETAPDLEPDDATPEAQHVATDERDEAADDPFSLKSADLSGLEALLSDDFARISAERDQYLDSLQRLQADFDNYRKRTDRQQAELRDRANQTLLSRLLPVLDALDLALAHLGLDVAPPEDEASASLVQVSTLLRDMLSREGLERIDAIGVPFDPTVHDATAMDDSAAEKSGTDDGAEDDGDVAPAGPTVAEVWRAGYRLKDRVIRPAMVRVRG